MIIRLPTGGSRPSTKRISYEITDAVGLRFIVSRPRAPGGADVTLCIPPAKPLMLVCFYRLGSLKDYLTSFSSAKQIANAKELFPIPSVRACGLFLWILKAKKCALGVFPTSWPHTACAPVVVSPGTEPL